MQIYILAGCFLCLVVLVALQLKLLDSYRQCKNQKPQALATDGTDWHVSPPSENANYTNPCPICEMPKPYGLAHRKQSGGWAYIDGGRFQYEVFVPKG